ncbi:PucR family transcriptional regulator [Amycolatopsis sp. H6(2020)]|nr:PucR family transcriptional regulator [Amycolatopsis sp. H6(2020)]
MSVPVRWLVEQRQLGLVVAGGAAGMDRLIAWAHSIELADPVPWLRGGELLLTTGLRLPRSVTERRRYVQRLDAAGVAALGFGIGLSHRVIPREIVDAADEAGLPLLEVPLPTPFVAITKAVTDRLAEQEYEGVVRASRVQPRMTRAALRGGVSAVVRELAVAMDAKVLLTDAHGAILSAHPSAAAALPADVLKEVEAAADAEMATFTSAAAGWVVTAQPVRVGHRLHGRVILVGERQLTPVDHLVIGHAVSLISLDQEKPLRLRGAQNRLNALVLTLLLEGNLDEAAALDHLRSAGFPVEEELVVLAVRGGVPQQLVAAIDRILSEKDLPCFAVPHDESVIVVLPGDTAALAQSLVARIAEEKKPALVAGLARTDTLAGVPAAVRQAVVAASVGYTRGARLVEFSTLAGHVLAGVPESRKALAALAETHLRPLADVDQRTGTDLVPTLRAFLEHNGQWEAASVALGVHRHTLRNRMTRIEQLLGVDLASAHVRAELLLSLVAWPLEPHRELSRQDSAAIADRSTESPS